MKNEIFKAHLRKQIRLHSWDPSKENYVKCCKENLRLIESCEEKEQSTKPMVVAY